MAEKAPRASVADAGAAALAFILQLLGLPANPAELLHRSGRAHLTETEILRLAKGYPVKARAIDSTLERLATTPMPALARLKNGAWLILGKAVEGKILVQDPLG
ncbi:MAG: cysteine peptidase family C39 domain-containing protein, partial [Caulobacteraceae bacterium]